MGELGPHGEGDIRTAADHLATSLAFVDVEYRYSKNSPFVLAGVSGRLQPGTVVALLGRNGTGKTTLVDVLVGTRRPTGGFVERSGRVGFVSQDRVLDPDLTLQEMLTLACRITGGDRAEVAEVVEALHLGDWLQTRSGLLSGGSQRRADIALGLVGRPETIILDEPTVGLDSQSRAGFWEVLRERSGRSSVLFTTQELGDVGRWAAETWLLHNGRLGPLDFSGHEGWVVVWRDEIDGRHEDQKTTLVEATSYAGRIERERPGSIAEIRRQSLEERFVELTGDEIVDAAKTTSMPSILRR